MPARDTDIRTVTLVDIPLVLRLIEKSIILDCEVSVTRDTSGTQGSISSLLLPQRGTHTMVARSDKQQVVGQFRLRPDAFHAQIVYLAPHLEADTEDTAWLHVLDAMAREAGKHSAHALLAEVDEDQPLFETLRTAGFAVYARQEIWRHEAGIALPDDLPERYLTEATADDEIGILSLLGAIVPGLVQPFAMPPAEMSGLIYRVDERIEAYFAYSEGKNGIFVIPYLHPDILPEAESVIAAALRLIPRAGKLPIYLRVRRYQDWISSALEDLQFTSVLRQALMVRHIAAGVRHAEFAPLSHQLEHATRPVKPNRYVDVVPTP
ncbi:MAG TPA: hypothetical protein VHL11_14700 [Phototrophicaceae bacterium]|nr:hypothetical protein [Phototrophicaceae bacterium]